MDITDDEIGAYWDRHLAVDVAGIPDRDAVQEMRARYIADIRASPEALRQIRGRSCTGSISGACLAMTEGGIRCEPGECVHP